MAFYVHILEDEYRALEPFHDINYPFRLFWGFISFWIIYAEHEKS
jgi:hypothetical protein